MNQFYKVLFSTLIALNILTIKANSQNDFINDSIILNQIDLQNLPFFKTYIEERGPNSLILGGSHTLLSIAVVENKFDLVKLMLQNGADINLIVNNMSPLMHCAVNDRPDIASYLIKNGAQVDLYNTHRNTALLYASRYGNVSTIKVLAQNRANPFFKNFLEYNSLYYAEEYFKTESAEYLKNYMKLYAKGSFPSTFDGPHVEWNGLNKIRAFYMVNDSSAAKIYSVGKRFRLKKDTQIGGIIDNDTLQYKIYKPLKRFKEETFTNVDNIFAVGDIHGAYDSLLLVLINNKIIDSKLNWTFGSGHLVFIGDLFDRGPKVTEVLWLVYKLWNEAPLSNGKVHILLGNHELLIFNKDYRYLNEKYSYLTRGLNYDFNYLFSTSTILGNFIRSFKVAVKIDSVLFVHAGISPFIAERKISIPDLNETFYKILNKAKNEEISERLISIYTDAISDKGPFWYRGYLTESQIISRAKLTELENVLKVYGAKTMVVGHTEVLSIDSIYEGRLIPINVPFDRVGIPKQALRIRKGYFYRCYSDGTEHLIM